MLAWLPFVIFLVRAAPTPVARDLNHSIIREDLGIPVTRSQPLSSDPSLVAARIHWTTVAMDATPAGDTIPIIELTDLAPRPADSMLVVLTPDLLARFTEVWTVAQKDSAQADTTGLDSIPSVIRDSIWQGPAAAAGTAKLLLDHEHGWPKFPNLRRFAAKDPAVAAAIRRSGLQPEQLLHIARAISLAWSDNLYWIIDRRGSDNKGVVKFQTHFNITQQADTTTLAGKNMLFVRAHRRSIEALGLGFATSG